MLEFRGEIKKYQMKTIIKFAILINYFKQFLNLLVLVRVSQSCGIKHSVHKYNVWFLKVKGLEIWINFISFRMISHTFSFKHSVLSTHEYYGPNCTLEPRSYSEYWCVLHSGSRLNPQSVCSCRRQQH